MEFFRIFWQNVKFSEGENSDNGFRTDPKATGKVRTTKSEYESALLAFPTVPIDIWPPKIALKIKFLSPFSKSLWKNRFSEAMKKFLNQF